MTPWLGGVFFALFCTIWQIYSIFSVHRPSNDCLFLHFTPPTLPFLPGLENVSGPLFIFKPPSQRGFGGLENSPLVVLFRYIEGPFLTPQPGWRVKFGTLYFPQPGHVAVATCPCCFINPCQCLSRQREKVLRWRENFGSIVEPLRVVCANMDKHQDHSSKWATFTWTMTLLMMMSCIIIKQPSSSLVNYTLSPCITQCLATQTSEVNER